jgi:hypothetical protein
MLAPLANNAAACGAVRVDTVRPLSRLGAEVDALLHKRAFEELDRRALEYRKPDALTSDGQAELVGLYDGVSPDSPCSRGPEFDAEFEVHNKLIAEWKKHTRVPETVAIMIAHQEMVYAWGKRGSGYSYTVTPEGRRQYQEHMAIAMSMLKALGPQARKDPFWYAERLTLAVDLGWEPQRFNALFDEAVHAFPDFYAYNSAKARFYSEKWYGSRAELTAFIDEAESSPLNKQGPWIIFARLHYANWPVDVKDRPSPSHMMEGFKNLLARYPDPYNSNRFAEYACTAGNPMVLREQLALIGDKISMTVWRNEPFLNDCRKYAAHAPSEH